MADDASGIGDGGGTVAGAAVVGEVLPALPEVRATGGAELAITSPEALEVAGMPGSLVEVEAWRLSGIAILEAAPDDETRLAVRDAAQRVRLAAEGVEDVKRQVFAAEVVERSKRSIGKAHGAGEPRDKGGRPPKNAPTENLATGRQVSGVVPRRTVRDYRADAEAVSDEGFEAVAEAASDAGQPLDRRTVRAAGQLEADGEDPADAVREPKTRPTLRDADRAPSRVMVEAAQVFFGECLTIDGPIVIGNGQDAPLDLDIYTAHETGHEWAPDPCPGYWRPHIWLAPPPRMQERYAWLLRNAFDRPRDRRPQRDDRVAATCPDGQSERQGQGAVVGEVGGGFWQSDREHPGKRSGAYRRDRLGQRTDRGFAFGCGRRGALAGPRGHVSGTAAASGLTRRSPALATGRGCCAAAESARPRPPPAPAPWAASG